MSSRHPPGPLSRFYGLGEMRKIQADLLGYYRDLARTYGDSVLVRLGPYLYHVFFHPEQVREVLVSKARSFTKMGHVRRVFAQLDGNGLVFSEGDFWLRQRRLMQPVFHPRRFPGYARLMVESTGELLARWRNDSVDIRDLDQEMTGLTLAIVGRALFGTELTPEQTRDTSRAVAILSETFVRELQRPFVLPAWFPWPGQGRKRWAIRFLDQTIRGIIRDRRATGEDRGDLLSMLLLAVDEEGDGTGMTDEQARDEAMTLFMAGHDSTAAGLTWIWYVLARYPEVADRVRAEVREVLGMRSPTAEDVPRLVYLKQVIDETMRLYPPAIGVFLREATQDVEIGGYLLKKGSLVQLLSFVTHRDPRWFPDPERFDPERFAPARLSQIPPFAYFPFGGGPRGCIGNHFALMEMLLVLATMLQHGHVSWPADQPHPDLLPHLSLRPRGGLRLHWHWNQEQP